MSLLFCFFLIFLPLLTKLITTTIYLIEILDLIVNSIIINISILFENSNLKVIVNINF